MALCPKCSWPLIGPEGEVPKCINTLCEYDPLATYIKTPKAEMRTGPGDPISIEIRNDGNMVAHCDKDDVWWLHVSGEEFKFRQLIEMMILLEESLDNLRKAMKDMVS